MFEDTPLLSPVSAEMPAPVDAPAAFDRVQFCGLPFAAAPGAFLPRAETELLARVALECAATLRADARLIDMCCGVGNVAGVLAGQFPQVQVWASDLMAVAARSARHNMEQHGLAGRVCVLHGDLFAPLTGRGLEGTIDLIVCNPPYISTKRLAQRADLLAREPREAFDAGPFGLAIHQRVMRAAFGFLRPGGWLVLEFGVGQARQVKRLFDRTRSYGETQLYADASGIARVAAAQAGGVVAGI